MSNLKYFTYLVGSFLVAILGLISCSTPTLVEPIAEEPVKFVFQEEPAVLPTWEKIAADMGVPPTEIEQVAKTFVGVLTYGQQSHYYSELCGPRPEICKSIDAYFADSREASRLRLQAKRERRRLRHKLVVQQSSVAWAQTLDLQRLLSGLYVRSEQEFHALANKALETTSCPRNFSAALSARAWKFFPEPQNIELSKKLFDQAEPCLSNSDPKWEVLYLRQGLFSLMQGNFDRAERLLVQALDGPTKVEQYRALYWLGWIQHQKGVSADDNRYWQILNAEFPLSYYSVKALIAWGKDPLQNVPELAPYAFNRISLARPELNQRLRWAEVLFLLNERSHAKRWLEWLSPDCKDLEVPVLHYLSAIVLKEGYYRQNILLLIHYYRFHPDRVDRSGLRSLYPRPYFDDIHEEAKDKIHTNLVMSLIRQESAFDPQAVSVARAKGLMQIIPRTARRLLRGGDRKLFDEKSNTQMGVKYLARLGDRFSGEVELALAAYNAGPNRVDEWLQRFPDRKDPLLWNDLIPYMETRDYVVSILRNNYWYERLYPMQISGDGILASKLVEQLKPSN